MKENKNILKVILARYLQIKRKKIVNNVRDFFDSSEVSQITVKLIESANLLLSSEMSLKYYSIFRDNNVFINLVRLQNLSFYAKTIENILSSKKKIHELDEMLSTLKSLDPAFKDIYELIYIYLENQETLDVDMMSYDVHSKAYTVIDEYLRFEFISLLDTESIKALPDEVVLGLKSGNFIIIDMSKERIADLLNNSNDYKLLIGSSQKKPWLLAYSNDNK